MPRRVSALLAGSRDRPRGRHLAAALVAAVLLLCLVPLDGAGAVHAAWDLGELLGVGLTR